jgi:hypothetical protein
MDISSLQHFDNAYAKSKYGMSPDEVVMSDLYGLTEEDVVKALSTSGSVPGGTDGSSLIGESLDPVVKVITLDAGNFAPLLRRVYTYEAKAIAEQFTQLNSLGISGGSFREEGDLGVQDSIQLSRVSKNVRFLGQTGAVTRAMHRAGMPKFGDVKALQAVGRLNKLLLDFERDVFWGNTDLNALSFEGLFQQMDSGSDYNIDKATTGTAGSRTTITAGGSLGLADLRGRADKFLTTGGIPTVAYLAPEDKYSISAEQDQNVRWYRQDVESRIAAGMIVDQLHTDFGEWIDLIWDIWLRNPRGKLFPEPEDPTDATKFHPEAPAIPGTAPTGVAAAGGHLPNDVYYYGVSFVNEAGEGPIKLQSSGYTADNTNGTINVTVTMPASIADIKSIRLYRSTTNGTDYSKMRLVSESQRTAAALATQVIADDGSIIPGSRTALMANDYAKAIGLLEGPNMRDLADIDNTHRFTISAMAVVQVYNSKNLMRWYNLGGSVIDPS